MRYRVILLIIAVLPIVAFAQSNERVYEELDFRFVTPGARAIGMGKTFVGLADDATAAYSNPAGLSNLLEQEFSFEFNTTLIRHHRFIPSLDQETQVFGDRVYAPSFFSYAYPDKSFTFSVFRNVVQHYREDFSFRGRRIPELGQFENGAFGNISNDSVNYGFGISYVVNRYISIGGTLEVATMDVDTIGGTGQADDPRSTSDTHDSATRPAGIIGILIKPNPRISFGAVFNSGAKFEMHTTLIGQFVFSKGDIRDLTGTIQPIEFVIPSRYSFGVSGKALQNLTLALDVSRIDYSSQITKNFLILNFISQLTRANYFIEDVTELHAGGEYRFYRTHQTFAVRAGVFTDPDHQLHFRALAGTDPFAAAVENFRFNSLKQHTDVGVTAGFGAAFANRFQADAAYSYSRDSREFILSFVVKL
ncbi:MAG: hypothetical protein C5B54_07595 [Acidobacteria bacterium]|nr:MAG: hypothetical protein C5B54_07595 [Acidobacteriota bacterium]